MRTVLVTGASTGIGAGCALRLCKGGWRVYAGVRRLEDGEELRRRAPHPENIRPVLLDVTDESSIGASVRVIAGEVGESGLDGLVNNAGIVVSGPLEFVPLDDFRRQLEVNVTGQLAVTQACLPLLRKAKGRIVNMGSVSGRMGTPMLGAYCASKFALDALSSTLSMELRTWGIHVSYISPGAIKTPFWQKALNEGNEMLERLPDAAYRLYSKFIDSMKERAVSATENALPSGEVVKAVVHALQSPKPRTRYPVGTMALAVEVGRLLPDGIRERIILSQFR